MKVIFCVFYCCFLFSQSAFGCTLAVQPFMKFDPSEYVFTGQVIGIVGPFESKIFRQKAWGLQIKVGEKVYLPQTPAEYFEVFPFQLWADCSTVGTAGEELLKYYPVGSSVKVIAKIAKLLPGRLPGGNIRLEILPGTWSDISRNHYEDGRQMADAQSVFDYKSFRQVTPADYVSSFMPFLDAKGALPEFELRKDLLRLNGAKSRNQRVRILTRLLYYPSCCGGGEYYGITKHYLGDSKLARALIRKREAWLNNAN